MKERLYVAIDTPDVVVASQWTTAMIDRVGGIKIGTEFFAALGPAGVGEISHRPLPVFLDLKLHDTPSTVARTIHAIHGSMPSVSIISVHASGGQAMMEAAARAAEETVVWGTRPRIVAATVLTSLDEEDLSDVGQLGPMAGHAMNLAALAYQAGLDGAIVSPHVCRPVRDFLGPDFLLITPAIRPARLYPCNSFESDDHKRTATPAYAIQAGADIVVVGRPITGTRRPDEAAESIVKEMEEIE